MELKNNAKTIELSFANDFKTRLAYQLSITGVTDRAGNALEKEIYNFGIAELPIARDILINEIMFENHQNSGYLDVSVLPVRLATLCIHVAIPSLC